MQKQKKYLSFVLIVLITVIAGCQTGVSIGDNSKRPVVNRSSFFSPEKIEITPLTELTGNSNKIKVYVAVFDQFGCQQKTPGIFRFELYRREVRSAEQKGKRIKLWEGIDLNNPDKNNTYWEDFLRCYEFELDFEQDHQPSILEVTCICSNQKRLSAEFVLIE